MGSGEGELRFQIFQLLFKYIFTPTYLIHEKRHLKTSQKKTIDFQTGHITYFLDLNLKKIVQVFKSQKNVKYNQLLDILSDFRPFLLEKFQRFSAIELKKSWVNVTKKRTPNF